jgi:protein SCO1/2
MTDPAPGTESDAVRAHGSGQARTRASWWIVPATIALAALVALAVPLLRPRPLPPSLGRVPAFELVDTSGTAFGSDELDGRIWVANTFFTRCVTICPRLTATMARLGDRLQQAGLDGVHRVSISVDPAHDTPDRLAAYGQEKHIDAGRWTLLTGPEAAVRSLVVDGFHLGLGQAEMRPEGFLQIAHSAKLILVDGDREIRGYFSADTQGIDSLVDTCRRLVRAGSGERSR